MKKQSKYTYFDAIMLLDDNWHVVYCNEYNSKGDVSKQDIFARCNSDVDAKLIVDALNKFNNE